MDGVEREFEGRLQVLRLNVQDAIGGEAAALYELRFTPTFIFFDESGHEVWRTIGALDPEMVRQSLGGS